MVDIIRSVLQRAASIAGEWQAATCVLCSARGASPKLDLCADCRADLPVNESACVRCAEPLAQRTLPGPLTCGACLRRPPRFDAALCALRYAYPVDHMVQRLKYSGAVAYGRVLGELLADRLGVHRAPLPDCIIPMPLAQQRFRERGYNQAIEIAAVLERRLPVRVRTDLVERIRHTHEQAELDRQQRRRNLRGAFAMCGELPGGHVAIVDDVVTTGSTANELARVLKRAGARRVEVWAVARAGREK